jgi:hypothetical protein
LASLTSATTVDLRLGETIRGMLERRADIRSIRGMLGR